VTTAFAPAAKVRHPEVVVTAIKLVDELASVLATRPEICEAYLFGSQARGDSRPHSDVDVAVYVDPAVPMNTGFGIDCEIAADLMKALGTNDIDVVLLNRAGPLLYHRVLRDGIRVLARDLAAATRREAMALSRYCDYLPQLGKIQNAERRRTQQERTGR
jgi:predicted nucleotidyltransferase